MQLRHAVDHAYNLFLKREVPSPRLNAELLALFVLGRERSYLYAHPEYELTVEEQTQYEEIITQRAEGCPTQYITGHQEFWGLDLMVSPAVLIPRPETEHVVETVLELVGKYYDEHRHSTNSDFSDCARIDSGRLRIVDVGVGSGCIALALASELPQAEIHGCDISEDALEIARINAARLALGSRVLFRKSDLLEVYLPSGSAAQRDPGEEHGTASSADEHDPAPGGRAATSEERAVMSEGGAAASPAPAPAPTSAAAEASQFDFVVANPPYVGESEADKVQKQVREFEPKIAVFCGTEGMEVYRRLIPQARQALRPGGWLVMEIGYSTEAEVKELLAAWTDVQTTADLQGIPRVMAARRA
ncbi:MAG TPA: HemK/PrmC family methyltransferase [Terriglobales bacterium]|jgi:release factor glutamine methyltransferase|nr:HemK/PrmC family methyltransferase [Terriglobales bacterium]